MKRPILQLALTLCLGASTTVALAADVRGQANSYEQLAAAGDATAPAPSSTRSTADTRPAADARVDDTRSAADPRAPLDRDERPRMDRDNGPRTDRDNDNSRTIGTTIDDAAITAKVKTALFTDELTKAWDIDVDTVRSVVTLRGRVSSHAEAERAERVANSTAGVSSVRNELEVGR
jgi:hyperosmotically inducible protein